MKAVLFLVVGVALGVVAGIELEHHYDLHHECCHLFGIHDHGHDEHGVYTYDTTGNKVY